MVNSQLIALGSNQTSTFGSPTETLRAALNELERTGAVIRSLSRFYHTPAFPAGSGPEFVNAAAEISAPGTPQQVLTALHGIEARFGRARRQRWGQRTLDIDLIAMGDTVLPDAETFAQWRDLDPVQQQRTAPDRLILPHPRLQDRAFVLVPLADVAPDWVHPVSRSSVIEMLNALPQADRKAVRPA